MIEKSNLIHLLDLLHDWILDVEDSDEWKKKAQLLVTQLRNSKK